MKVLVVDDEPLVRRSFERALKNHEVFLAENGSDGLKVWRQQNPDLVFLDVIMPGLSGPQVLKEIGKKHSGKVILMSAFAGGVGQEEAHMLGADLFISKPFEDIFKVIQQGEELVDG